MDKKVLTDKLEKLKLYKSKMEKKNERKRGKNKWMEVSEEDSVGKSVCRIENLIQIPSTHKKSCTIACTYNPNTR